MPRIFISYRRADSQHLADRLFDSMEIHFGEGNVFQDVDRVPIGVDFVAFLREAIQKTDVVLVVIGPAWAQMMRERANEENDFVRIEVEQALALGKLVIPVKMRDTPMPSARDLPRSIRGITRINAAQMRPNPDWKHDCKTLADSISRALEEKAARIAQEAAEAEASGGTRSVAITSNGDWMPFIQTFTVHDIALEMCLVPPGTFIMGSNNGDINERPTHPQTLSEHYWIGVHPVTNAQWRSAVQRSRGAVKPPEWADWYNDSSRSQQPVVGVSWLQCARFARWLGEEWSLPSELESERATLSFAMKGVSSKSEPPFPKQAPTSSCGAVGQAHPGNRIPCLFKCISP